MAQRRMFSQKIVGSDAFIEMPVSARELYFQLGMYADDDGFINPKKIVRMLGASDDDLKVLAGKRFVLPFENGVVVIKHWKINNLIRKDFYEETIYLDQKNKLTLKENKSYTECNKNVNNLLPQYSIDKVSKDKYSIDNISDLESQKIDPVSEVFKTFYDLGNKGINFGNKTERLAAKWLINTYGLEKTINTIKFAMETNNKPYAPVITTPYQLKNNIAKLMAFYNKEKSNQRFVDLDNL